MSEQPDAGAVLAAVLEYGELPEILRTADLVRGRMARDVVVFFAKPQYRRLAEDTAAVIAQGHVWMDSEGRIHKSPAKVDAIAPECAPTAGAAEEPGLRPVRSLPVPFALVAACAGAIIAACASIVTGAVRGLKDIVVDLVNTLADGRRFKARARFMEGLMARLRPSLAIMAQAPVGSELAFFARAARRCGVPSLLVPFAMFNLREVVEYANARPTHGIGGRPLNWLLALLYPHWVAAFRDHRILRLPGSRGLVLELAGLVDGNPWLPCAERVSAFACDSREAQRNLAAMGIPADRFDVVGAPVHDRLAAHLSRGLAGKRELVSRFGLTGDRPLITCGWPANIFEWAGGRGACYADYPSLARAWASALAVMRDRHGVEILVSVHPKTLDDEIQEALARRLSVVRGESDLLVAHCDLFTTLNGSSLTAWAIACAKPVLLFDCYGTGYKDFDAVPGCIIVHSESQFAAELDRLCGDAAARAQLAQAQQGIAADWGELDGRATERLAALAANLISSGP